MKHQSFTCFTCRTPIFLDTSLTHVEVSTLRKYLYPIKLRER